MPSVRYIPEGEAYQPAAGEHLLQLQNAGSVPLYIGILKGEYMVATTGTQAGAFLLDNEQWVRLQQQLKRQATYKSWVSSGLLTLVEVPELPVPTPPEEEPAAAETPAEEPPPPAAPEEPPQQ